MLNIFYGRESIDKEKFIYESIGRTENTLVLVPDQYTLEAEKKAFRILNEECLLNMEILSFSRLGGRVLKAEGGENKTFIDKYGRHMLLSQILQEVSGDLKVFRNMEKKNSFIEMVNNFISEMKQYNVTPEDLRNLIGGEGILERKLADLHKIFAAYEDHIAGKYTDTEDYIELYKNKIAQSEMLKKSHIWIYGFDSFAPKMISVIGEFIGTAQDVNVVLTSDYGCPDEEIFTLSHIVMGKLEKAAMEKGSDYARMQITGNFVISRDCPAVEEIEKQIYATRKAASGNFSGLTIVEAANAYNEAESAAAHILHLVRDCGFRYRDIVVICNDLDSRGSIISRVFGEYGISLFDDRKRVILNSPIAVYVISILECIANKYRTSDLIRTLKTGFSDLSDDDVEALENYTYKYRIKGSMWKKPFLRGAFEYGEEELERLDGLRKTAAWPLEVLEKIVAGCETYGEFIKAFYEYLLGAAGLIDKIETLIKTQEDMELLDLADETRQIWASIMGLLDQIYELMGGEKLDLGSFVELLALGLSQIEVGVLPQSGDSVMLGTMQRTRSADVRAVVVLGANEGILPSGASGQNLFTIAELESLSEQGKEICKVEKVRLLEEKLAIYRNLSKASDSLWISYCTGDTEGKAARPSEIAGELQRVFPKMIVERDILNRSDMTDLIGGEMSTLRHLSEAVHKKLKKEVLPAGWSAVMKWYEENYPAKLALMLEGFNFANEQKNLSTDVVRKLYEKRTVGAMGAADMSDFELKVSPSRMETFSRCPFSHFISYGLRPEERRIYETGGREIGDVYHACIMKLSEKLTEENLWHSVEEEQCKGFVRDIVEAETAGYRDGLFGYSNAEIYSTKRLAEEAFYTCWGIVEQVREGKIQSSLFEAPFGRGKPVPSIEIECGKDGAGGKVYIEGKIDRVDYMENGRVKIIDYKTGHEDFNINEARKGYRLQLMTYLKAAQQGSGVAGTAMNGGDTLETALRDGDAGQLEPAGVFYFLIDDPKSDLTGTGREKFAEKISADLKKFFRLNGIMINDPEVIDSIAGNFDGYSDVVPLRKKKDGTIIETGSEFLLDEADFAQLQSDVDDQLRKIANEMISGRIEIKPKKTDKTSPCVYCRYKGICRFDTDFKGCNYEMI